MYISIIVPAYNEEKRIGETLQAVADYFHPQSYVWEVIVVNNHSQDDTERIVKEFQKEMPELKLINENSQGKGHAVRTGMLAAQGKFRLFTDADNSTSIEQVEKLMPYFSQGYGVVIGSIAVKGKKILKGGGEPLWRVILGKLGNLWIQVWAVPGIHDTQRGFKVFSQRAATDIFPRLTIFGWGFDIEALALARKFGYKIKEVPVIWNNDPDSKVNIWAYPRVLLETLKVRWNLWTGRYK